MVNSRFVCNLFLFFSLGAALVCGGCSGPTYPKETLNESLRQLCLKEGNVAVQSALIEKNLMVYFSVERLFDEQLNIVPEALKPLDSVMQCTTRVLLSTDAEIDFYTVIISDSGRTPAEMLLTRYVPDTLKFIYSWISRDEYRLRLLWDFKVNLSNPAEAFDFSRVQRFTLPVFLVRQIEKRINLLLESSKRFYVAVRGSYRPQSARMIFSLPYADEALFSTAVAPVVLQVASYVITEYRLAAAMHSVTVYNELTRQEISINPEEFETYAQLKPEQLLRDDRGSGRQ